MGVQQLKTRWDNVGSQYQMSVCRKVNSQGKPMCLGHAEAKGSWQWGSDDEESPLSLYGLESWVTGEGWR